MFGVANATEKYVSIYTLFDQAIARQHHKRPSDPTISVEAMRSLVEWVRRADYERWIEAHRDQAAVSANGQCVQTWGELYATMPKP